MLRALLRAEVEQSTKQTKSQLSWSVGSSEKREGTNEQVCDTVWSGDVPKVASEVSVNSLHVVKL